MTTTFTLGQHRFARVDDLQALAEQLRSHFVRLGWRVTLAPTAGAAADLRFGGALKALWPSRCLVGGQQADQQLAVLAQQHHRGHPPITVQLDEIGRQRRLRETRPEIDRQHPHIRLAIARS